MQENMNVMEEEEHGRQGFFRNLLGALGPSSEDKKLAPGTFAACEVIKPSQGFVLRSIQVEGVGELELPLSTADASKLRTVCEQAPYGKGSATLVDTNVRCCWQVDALKVSFPRSPTFLSDVIQALATRAVRALGMGGVGMQIEAHLYKLLFYEAGGHFTSHRDTEKERGMFGTLILQLPTTEGYTGGELLVKHHKEEKKFDCQMVSSLGFCHTVFFADCLHELKRIDSGTRVCLAFNLIKRDSSSDPILKELISHTVQKAEAALEPWRNATAEGKLNFFVGGKLAFPLKHKYTEANVSFAGLKGDDNILAKVMKNVRDQNGQKWLDLHLCLVTKYQSGTPSYSRYSRYYRQDFDSDSHYMEKITEETVKFKKWMEVDDQPTSVTWILNLTIDFEKEVVVEEQYQDCPFNLDPDETEYEGNMGNYGPTLEYWYHKAMLVVWPKGLSISIRCELGVFDVLASLQIHDPNICGELHQIVVYCQRNALKVWDQNADPKKKVWDRNADPKKDSVTPLLLSLCTRASLYEDVLQILQLLAKPLISCNGTFKRIGVGSVDGARAIATAVQVMGWELLSSSIIDLAKHCSLTQSESFAELAKELIFVGSKDAGELVARTIFEVLEAKIAQLESQMPLEPVFSWCQPHARIPGQPNLERFLEGPTEKFVVTGFSRIAEARAFAEKYCNIRSATYNVTGTPGEQGRASFCEIQKTRHLFDAAKENWSRKQEEVKRFRDQLGLVRSSIPKTSPGTNVTPLLPTEDGVQDL